MPHSSWHRAATALYPKASDKGQRAGKGQRKGAKGKGPILKRPKAPRAARHPGFAMLSLFQRKGCHPPPAHRPHPPSNSERVDAAGVGRIAAGHAASAETAGTHLAAHIALAPTVRHALPRPLERYAELVQQFPASENHHHAYPGGMLDHGLEIVAYALGCGSHTCCLPASRRRQAAQAEAWTAGTAYAALLHDIGKIAVDLHVEHADGSVWHPWHGPLRKPTASVTEGREYRLHSAATGLLYARASSIGTSSTGSAAILTSGPRCCTCWPASTSTPARSANWSCRPTRHRSPRNSAAIPAKALAAPGMRCNANCSTACATCSRKSSS